MSVECDMADPPVTIIHHNMEDDRTVMGYSPWWSPGSMPIQVAYTGLTYQNIRPIITSSEVCSYHIRVAHHKISLTGSSYWKSFEGEIVEWANSTDTMCQGIFIYCQSGIYFII